MRADQLHVVVPISNPSRWNSRIKLYKEFENHMLESGVRLHVVECAYGDIPHVLGDTPGINHIPVWAKTHIWNKEAMINLAISRLPRDWKYVAWIDGDVRWRKQGWASETIYALQQWDFVQPWSHCYDLGPNGEHIQTHESFCSRWVKKCPHVGQKGSYTFAHPGYAWASTRTALENVGGLIDTAILGAGDHHMALALIGKAGRSLPGGVHPNYARPILQWQKRANAHVAGDIGFIPWTIEHSFHGSKQKRKYVERWDILVDHKFDPDYDIKRNTCGLWELSGNKPEFKRDIHIYNRQRQEDANTMD